MVIEAAPRVMPISVRFRESENIPLKATNLNAKKYRNEACTGRVILRERC